MSGSLVVDGLTKRFGAVAALTNARLSVARGEVVALIGPNGSGKTTLLDAVAGQLDVDAGSVARDARMVAPSERSTELFYLPDGIRPWPAQRVGWVLEMCEQLNGGSSSARAALIQRLGLEALLAARMGTLSKGEHRRVMLAIALNTPQPMLVLDEPFDGLDLRQTREVMSLLREHAARDEGGRGILVSIHQLADAERVADRFVLLDRGRVAGSGTMAELRAKAGLPDSGLEEVFLALT